MIFRNNGKFVILAAALGIVSLEAMVNSPLENRVATWQRTNPASLRLGRTSVQNAPISAAVLPSMYQQIPVEYRDLTIPMDLVVYLDRTPEAFAAVRAQQDGLNMMHELADSEQTVIGRNRVLLIISNLITEADWLTIHRATMSLNNKVAAVQFGIRR